MADREEQPAERVTVLDLMAQASASVPDTGAAAIAEPATPGPEDLIERVERLTADLEVVPEPGRSIAEELVSAVLELHGDGLARILAALDRAGEAGEGVQRELVDDGVVASLMLIHDLYPVPLEQRVQEGLDSVRPYMESHGGNVELLGIEDGVAKLRLQGSCSGCAASSATLELAVQKALQEAAPDLIGMDVEGVEEEPTHEPPIGRVPLPLASESVPELSGWRELDGIASLGEGLTTVVDAGGVDLLVANVEGTLLAYRDACPGCGGALASAALAGGVLACPGCGVSFDLPRAGRAVGDPALQLGPVPLLRDADGGDARVRVALAP